MFGCSTSNSMEVSRELFSDQRLPVLQIDQVLQRINFLVVEVEETSFFLNIAPFVKILFTFFKILNEPIDGVSMYLTVGSINLHPDSECFQRMDDPTYEIAHPVEYSIGSAWNSFFPGRKWIAIGKHCARRIFLTVETNVASRLSIKHFSKDASISERLFRFSSKRPWKSGACLWSNKRICFLELMWIVDHYPCRQRLSLSSMISEKLLLLSFPTCFRVINAWMPMVSSEYSFLAIRS